MVSVFEGPVIRSSLYRRLKLSHPFFFRFQIMFRYLELCVDLKKSHVAKEGLFQYRNMCQSTNVASLASVVQGYLTMAEKRTDSAKQESVESVQVQWESENCLLQIGLPN